MRRATHAPVSTKTDSAAFSGSIEIMVMLIGQIGDARIDRLLMDGQQGIGLRRRNHLHGSRALHEIREKFLDHICNTFSKNHLKLAIAAPTPAPI